MDAIGGHRIKQNKPDTKGYVSYFLLFVDSKFYVAIEGVYVAGRQPSGRRRRERRRGNMAKVYDTFI